MLAALALTLLLAAEPIPPIDRHAVEVAPRTALYCEDSTHAIQPSIFGDFGDLVAAYDRLHHMRGKVISNGKRADGEDYDALMFEATSNDPRSPGETVAFVITRHADGYALRAVYDQPPGLPMRKTTGNDMCFTVLKMFLDSDPARAVAHRNRWMAEHPDSTSR